MLSLHYWPYCAFSHMPGVPMDLLKSSGHVDLLEGSGHVHHVLLDEEAGLT
jgi:hypothetical protein